MIGFLSPSRQAGRGSLFEPPLWQPGSDGLSWTRTRWQVSQLLRCAPTQFEPLLLRWLNWVGRLWKTSARRRLGLAQILSLAITV